jgi:hypothetical protein
VSSVHPQSPTAAKLKSVVGRKEEVKEEEEAVSTVAVAYAKCCCCHFSCSSLTSVGLPCKDNNGKIIIDIIITKEIAKIFFVINKYYLIWQP